MAMFHYWKKTSLWTTHLAYLVREVIKSWYIFHDWYHHLSLVLEWRIGRKVPKIVGKLILLMLLWKEYSRRKKKRKKKKVKKQSKKKNSKRKDKSICFINESPMKSEALHEKSKVYNCMIYVLQVVSMLNKLVYEQNSSMLKVNVKNQKKNNDCNEKTYGETSLSRVVEILVKQSIN